MCGVFGIAGNSEAAKLTYLGLHALQHRGQESGGIVVTEGEGREFRRHVGQGLVADVFTESILDRLTGDRAIGHVRYSTAGGNDISNAQPLMAETLKGPISLGHNGNLTNALQLREELERQGAIFRSRADTEVILHLLVRSRAPRLADRLREALAQVEGAYTLIVMNKDSIIGVRDPSGFRPLVLGKVRDAYVLASETSVFDLLEGEFIREVEPGEMVVLEHGGVRSERLLHAPDALERRCIFELIYFAKPNSKIFGHDVYETRHELGRQLAREAPAEADIVIPVPDSGVSAALGYAEEAGLPFRHGLLRSHYVGRTFIEPAQAIRHFGVRLKLAAVRSILADKRVVVVDDSIVRGTTSRKIVSMLRAAGAKEVHLRISSPPTRSPCYYGIDTPTKEELIAAQQDVEAIRKYVNSDSLAYLSVEGLHAVVGDERGPRQRFCNACFTGDYPASAMPETLR